MTWNDVIELSYNKSSKATSCENFQCWHIFRTPYNEIFDFNRENFFTYLISEVGMLEAPFDNLVLIHAKIGSWSYGKLQAWQRIFDALCAEYEPLWNYNRFDEEFTDTDKVTENEENSEKNVAVGESTHETTSNSVQNETSEKVAGYDSGSLVDSGEISQTSNNDKIDDFKRTIEQSETDDKTASEKMNQNVERNLHAYGNIGVMSTQQLVEQEIELGRFSIYEIMLTDFKKDMCVCIY